MYVDVSEDADYMLRERVVGECVCHVDSVWVVGLCDALCGCALVRLDEYVLVLEQREESYERVAEEEVCGVVSLVSELLRHRSTKT